MRLRTSIGLLRSLAMYHGPFWRRSRMDALYGAYVRPGDLCFDVGAHVGNRVGCFLRLGARVVAVEPQPVCLTALRALYGGRDDVVIVEAACAAQAGGTCALWVSERTPTVSSVDRSWIDGMTASPRWAGVRWDHPVEVPRTSLDALIAEHGSPAFVKIDVEGAELAVLEGLSQPVPALSFEFVPEAVDRARACIERIERFGAHTYRVTLAERHTLGAPLDADGLRRWLDAMPAPAGRAGVSGDVFAQRR